MVEFDGKGGYETTLTREIDLSETKTNDWSETIKDGFKTNFKLKSGEGVRFSLTWQEASIPINFKNSVTFDGEVNMNFYIQAGIPQPVEGFYQPIELSELLTAEERSVSSESILMNFENEYVDRLQERLECLPGEAKRTVQEKYFVQPGRFAGIAKGGFDADATTKLMDATSFSRRTGIDSVSRLGQSRMSTAVRKSRAETTLWRIVEPLALQSPGDWCYTGPCADPLDGTREECYLECVDEDDEGKCEGLACTDCRAIEDVSCEPAGIDEDE